MLLAWFRSFPGFVFCALQRISVGAFTATILIATLGMLLLASAASSENIKVRFGGVINESARSGVGEIDFDPVAEDPSYGMNTYEDTVLPERTITEWEGLIVDFRGIGNESVTFADGTRVKNYKFEIPLYDWEPFDDYSMDFRAEAVPSGQQIEFRLNAFLRY